jgi:hypothetical protein
LGAKGGEKGWVAGGITENLAKQTGDGGLAGVYGHNGAAAIFVPEK